jgi:nitrite reductase (NADH) large subunit
MDYCAAFIQLYREEARYLERTAPWIERVGLAHITARIVDDPAGREALRARFLHSQSFSQDDPWAQRAEGAEAEHHAPMARFTPQEELA